MAKVENMVSKAGEQICQTFIFDDNDDTAGLEISARCDAMLEEEEPRTMLKVIKSFNKGYRSKSINRAILNVCDLKMIKVDQPQIKVIS